MMRALHAAARLCAVCSLLPAAGLAQHPVMEISVAGNDRLAAAAVIAASGLRQGQIATRAQLDAAAKKLASTGMFTSVSYRYDPKTVGGVTGYALTLLVSEQPARAPVALEIPGLETDQLWKQLKASDPLIGRQMPDNEEALDYLKRSIETVLRKLNHPEEIVLKTEVNLGSGKVLAIVCRTAHPPKVEAIRFEGNATVSTDALEAAMQKVAMGQDYSERDFRRMLELNVRPLYEEAGCLKVAFPRIAASNTTENVTVTARIEEGALWKLGKVVLSGDALPLAEMHEAARFDYGAPANWKKLLEAVRQMEKVLRRDGYLRAYGNPVRSFRDSEQVVDVSVEFRKGPQFLFGELHIEGLDPVTQQRVAALWKLPGGAPVNVPYIDEFVHSATPVWRGKSKACASEVKVRSGANVADVWLRFQ